MAESDSLHSSRREKLIDHVFVGEVLRELWCVGAYEVDVLRAETDTAGYDVVIEVGAVSRHVQLKSSAITSETSRQTINVALGSKQSGCAVWVMFDPDTMQIGPFKWFGGKPGETLPDITGFPVAKHTKGNAKGEKADRKNLRVLNKGKFVEIRSIVGVIEQLFGPRA